MGSFGALSRNGFLCTDPFAALANAACFAFEGQRFGWLQGTSMSSPNAAAVAAFVLSARTDLRFQPEALTSRHEDTARTGLTNYMGRTIRPTGRRCRRQRLIHADDPAAPKSGGRLTEKATSRIISGSWGGQAIS